MRHGQGTFGRVCALAAAALALGGAAPGTSDVTIAVTGLRSGEGVVRACMTADETVFPKCRSDAKSYRVVVPATGKVRLTFHDVMPGRYAIALLHDENNNGKADRAMMMMPKEGFGFSRDAPVKMGPPSFDAASFKVDGKPLSQTIRMRYML